MRQLACVVAVAVLAGCGTNRGGQRTGAATALAEPPAPPYLMFVSVASDDTFRRVGLAGLQAANGAAYFTPLACERVYFSGGRGVCLTSAADGTQTKWFADLFDGRFERTGRLALTGTPSRVRISGDGRLAAATVFETGHAYDEHGFSTRTTIIDIAAASPIGELEQFTTRRDGAPFKADDFNFWGVTFARDSDAFYATLQTGSVSYLVRGSVAQRTMDILRPGVECPSISPDNSRIAFKKRVGTQSRGWWQLAVMPLDTLKESLITAETRGVDDQVEWLDDRRVAYHLTGGSSAADLWSVTVDSSAPPQLLREAAYSPAAVQPTGQPADQASHSK